jgi:hypothetical protein
MIKKTTSVADRVLPMTPAPGVRVDPIVGETMPRQQVAARPVRGHCLPLTALLLATMMSVSVAHAASRRDPPVVRASGGSVPTYDIQAACRDAASIPEARLAEGGGSDTAKRCVDDENQAREQLVERWPQFKAADRAMCTGASRSGPVNPTYTELVTCLEMTRDNPGNETVAKRRGARPESPRSATADASSPQVIARSPIVEQPLSQPTGTAQQTPAQGSLLDQPPAPSSEKAVDAETQVAELKRTIENLRSELASSQRRIANLEKEKEEAQSAATQAEQARRDLESARHQIEQTSVAERIQLDVKNRRLAIPASAAIAGLVLLLAITVSVVRRRAVRGRPT